MSPSVSPNCQCWPRFFVWVRLEQGRHIRASPSFVSVVRSRLFQVLGHIFLPASYGERSKEKTNQLWSRVEKKTQDFGDVSPRKLSKLERLLPRRTRWPLAQPEYTHSSDECLMCSRDGRRASRHKFDPARKGGFCGSPARLKLDNKRVFQEAVELPEPRSRKATAARKRPVWETCARASERALQTPGRKRRRRPPEEGSEGSPLCPYTLSRLYSV